MDKRKKIIIFASIIIASFVADIGTKIWAQKNVSAHYVNPDTQKSFRITFNLAYNRGAAFSLGAGVKGGRWILVFIRLAALGFVYYLFTRPEANSKLFLTGLAMVGGGAMGNLIETILYGKVTDFIQFWGTPAIQKTWPWPTFNIADMVLLVGVGLMVIYSFITPAPDSATGSKGDPTGRQRTKKSTKKSSAKSGTKTK